MLRVLKSVRGPHIHDIRGTNTLNAKTENSSDGNQVYKTEPISTDLHLFAAVVEVVVEVAGVLVFEMEGVVQKNSAGWCISEHSWTALANQRRNSLSE